MEYLRALHYGTYIQCGMLDQQSPPLVCQSSAVTHHERWGAMSSEIVDSGGACYARSEAASNTTTCTILHWVQPRRMGRLVGRHGGVGVLDGRCCKQYSWLWSVMVTSDNTTAVAYIRRQRGQSLPPYRRWPNNCFNGWTNRSHWGAGTFWDDWTSEQTILKSYIINREMN